jgi:putative membrane protein insertion efficiency factor
MRYVVQLVLRSYKRFISPMLPASCKYTPTCSEYAMEAVELHGVLRGGLMSAWRLLRCNPFSKGGFDPVERLSDFALEKIRHSERSEESMHSHTAAKCIGPSLRSG